MPTRVSIVDLRKEFQAGRKSIFSKLLHEKMAYALAHKKQIVLFLNKRGFFSSLTCRSCGYMVKCTHCDVAMTYHRISLQKEYLLCHYCGKMQKVPHTCPSCSSSAIRFFGIGTQNIVEHVQELFPKARIARADRDSTRKKHDFEDIYRGFVQHEIDILVGTQMIAKGLDIANVALVGILLADISLHIPDFRAAERTFQLLTQVAGRTGRQGNFGEVVLQTYLPEQPSIVYASEENYEKFYMDEIEQRKMYGYPPFTQIIKLMYVHPNAQKCKTEAERFYQILQKALVDHASSLSSDIEIFMATPLISKLHDKYHYNIVIKGKNIRPLFDFISLPPGWRVDVDPVNV